MPPPLHVDPRHEKASCRHAYRLNGRPHHRGDGNSRQIAADQFRLRGGARPSAYLPSSPVPRGDCLAAPRQLQGAHDESERPLVSVDRRVARGRRHCKPTAQRAPKVYGVTSSPRFSPRLALRPGEAAQALGCSRDFFDEHIAPELRWIRRGRLKFVAIAELEDWLRRGAALSLDGVHGPRAAQ
jgi:hypothetical protein